MDDVAALLHVAAPRDMIDPARTALVLVDLQVDFAAPHGLLGRVGVDMSPAEPVIDRAEAMIAAARSAGVTVAFMRVVTTPETDSVALTTWMERRGTPGGEAICRTDTGGADYYRVRPEPGDIEIQKLKYSSFHKTDLDAQLRARGIDTLVICGITTDCCVDATTRDGFHHDYHVFVVSDACTAYDDAVHHAALASMNQHCALLLTSAAVVEAWS
jgi:nicotinamidase-related amidase